ncbi:hypothetical protein GMW39_11130 [Pectobacterium parmentieri]|uniref:hypothetical protein n=1 Tax=Pectobacterium parmentieri TaxID=1905730 RepID=UPI000CDD17A3|nr:hypothetical protein [Pectobacterium parmentieri]AYH14045.1 hypothetical protein C5E23_07560 [Pectobacterium parmentieri]POW28441.1 hypothetical protein PB20LOC_01646 [Pectobacterium parmentieri]QHQ16359.1 hypothetical protein GMW39_11130 [Pectobacterium parmentieri]QPK20968.1 hypothetical protein PB20LOC_005415 [Pectobacterium parmentieri]QRN31391.1 hypothetical protein IG623_07465 [Pectobacterium parmentieri]
MSQLANPVFSLYYIGLNLKKGITAQHFEHFARHHGVKIPAYPGWRWSLLKGLRGERENQYMMLYEAPDAVQYARYIDSHGEQSDEASAFWQQHPEALRLIDEWKTFATFPEPPTIFSYFSLIAENTHSSLPEGPNYQTTSGQENVARVVGIHNLALRSGVAPETFEKFINDNIHRVEDYPGWKFHMLKGEGGNRLDQYVVMLEIESLASLNSFHPELDVSTEKALTFVREHADTECMYDEWRALASFSGAPQIYTDYITIAGHGL